MVYSDPDKYSLYNYKKSDILNYTNAKLGTNYTSKQFTYSEPKVNSGDYNTTVNMIPTKENGIPNIIKVDYNRVPISLMCYIFGNGVAVPRSCKETYDILPFIAEQFGIVLYKEEFINYPLRWDDTNKDNSWATLKAKATSLIYNDGCEIKLYKQAPSLNGLIKNKQLVNFKQVLPHDSDKVDVSNLLYNYNCDRIDFNSITSGGKYYPRGLYNSIIEWKVITSETAMLFNNPYNTIVDPKKIDLTKCTLVYDGPTKGYPDSNQKYSWVSVLDIGDQPHFTGKLFLHQNKDK